ncbi:loricrin-like [Eucalyptus grandis]|uniref:loricrin-like n=1 Tax=Eucalyptus grandis TaxID=71139 RepID=UPI00192E77B8|nr:loricrin-like [Eucalyptus grandis]
MVRRQPELRRVATNTDQQWQRSNHRWCGRSERACDSLASGSGCGGCNATAASGQARRGLCGGSSGATTHEGELVDSAEQRAEADASCRGRHGDQRQRAEQEQHQVVAGRCGLQARGPAEAWRSRGGGVAVRGGGVAVFARGDRCRAAGSDCARRAHTGARLTRGDAGGSVTVGLAAAVVGEAAGARGCGGVACEAAVAGGDGGALGDDERGLGRCGLRAERKQR